MSVDTGFDHGFVDKTFDGFGYIVLTHPFFYHLRLKLTFSPFRSE
jgi:hypothetical protein